MANSYTLTEVASLCHNEVRLIGTLVEFAADSYIKNDVAVVRYKGVVRCNDAFIDIKATTTSFDDTFKPFVDEFNTDATGHKVFIIGKINSRMGVNVDYIAIAYKEDFFEGIVDGIPYDEDKFLIVDNEYHNILPIDIEHGALQDNIIDVTLTTQALEWKDGVITNVGYPPIIPMQYGNNKIVPNAHEIVNQALEERQIYLEAMNQIKEGR